MVWQRPYFEQVFWAGLAGVSYLPATIVPTGPDDEGSADRRADRRPRVRRSGDDRSGADSRTTRFRFPLAAGILISPTRSSVRSWPQAHPNIALVKYWGKRDGQANVPATPSLSITLSHLRTRTHVAFDPAFSARRVTPERRDRAGCQNRRLHRSLGRAAAGRSRRCGSIRRTIFRLRRVLRLLHPGLPR